MDARSIVFRETTVTTKHLAEGIAADYDRNGQLSGIEILDVVKRFGGHDKAVIYHQIDATDHQIDQLVYELYGLTEDEIKIVENQQT